MDADVCLAAALSPKCHNVTFEVASHPPSSAANDFSLYSMLSGLNASLLPKATQITAPASPSMLRPDELFGTLSPSWDEATFKC